MRNLPKKGWAVDGDVGTFQDLKIDFGEANWILSKEGDEVASGEYGRTQMADVKKAAKDAGTPFDAAGGGGKKSTGGGPSAKAKQAAARAKAKKAAPKAGKEPDAGDDPEG
jgi:hypothetical protein